jgi:hypothetical protein
LVIGPVPVVAATSVIEAVPAIAAVQA